MKPVTVRGLCAGALLALWVAMPAAADRLHLDSGGVIDTNRWWIEGDWLHYESPTGTIGVPRAAVVSIENSASEVVAGRVATRAAAIAGERPGAPRRASRLKPEQSRRIAELIERAEAALAAKEFQLASDTCREILGLDPNQVLAYAGYALSEMKLGRDRIAQGVVLDGLSRAPDNPSLRELLGDLRDREERVHDALREWKQAFDASPSDRLRDKILKAQRELQAGGDFDMAATSHFTVRYDGEVDRALADEVMEYLEEQYWELADRFRHAPPQPITVQLLPKQAFRDVTQTPEWVGGLYDGKIRVPLGGLRRLNPVARSVLAHELTHAVVHSKTRGQCPRWLHEGLAQIVEGRTATPSDDREVRRLLIELGPARWESSGLSYPAALSLTRFLERQRGFSGLIWLLEGLAEGESLDAALRRTYGWDYDRLCREWATGTLESSR